MSANKDLSRGFLCGYCKAGTIFPQCTNANQPPGQPFIIKCDTCDQFDMRLDWKKISKEEKHFEKLFTNWESEIEAKGILLFHNHWIQEKFWNFAQDYFDNTREYDRAI